MEMRMKIHKIIICAAGLSLMSMLTSAETLEEYANKCKQALEIDYIPGFTCSDGIPLTDSERSKLILSSPSGSTTFGKVPTSNPAVNAVFLCREINGSTVFLDGYILQNKKNGQTCFFDKQTNSSVIAPPIDFTTPAKAAAANANWRSPSTLEIGGPCLLCHNNDPFIISDALSRAAKELGLIGTSRPLSEKYHIVETVPETAPKSPLNNGNNYISQFGAPTKGPSDCAGACHTVRGAITSMTTGMPAIPGGHYLSWPTERLMHMDSGKCIHPLYGTATEGNKAVVWYSCDDQNRLKYQFTDTGKLQEKASNRCLDVDSVAANQNVLYRSDCQNAKSFMVTNLGQLKVYGTNFCIEPASAIRTNDTELVLKDCSETSTNQKFTSISLAKNKISQFTSNMCWRTEDGTSYPAPDKRRIVLSNSCNDESSSFKLLENGLIKHIPSGYCVHPSGGAAGVNVEFILFSSCEYEERLAFETTAYGSVKHKLSGLCAHPYLGSPTPAEGTPLIFYSGCNSGSDDRLKFIFK